MANRSMSTVRGAASPPISELLRRRMSAEGQIRLWDASLGLLLFYQNQQLALLPCAGSGQRHSATCLLTRRWRSESKIATIVSLAEKAVIGVHPRRRQERAGVVSALRLQADNKDWSPRGVANVAIISLNFLAHNIGQNAGVSKLAV